MYIFIYTQYILYVINYKAILQENKIEYNREIKYAYDSDRLCSL